MKLEVATNPVVEDESDEESDVLELSGYEMNPDDDGGSAWAEETDSDYEDVMDNIEDLMSYEDMDL